MDYIQLGFESNVQATSPLADRMRPQSLDDFVGQSHLLGQNQSLRRMIQSDRLSSMIFFGPPGTGKTTLALIIAKTTKMNFEKISAVTSGVKEIREIVQKAKNNLLLQHRGTIVFIDEIHRFNKSQQDALLPHVEKGLLILIGATTENPYFEINKALLSRCRILELKVLTESDIIRIIQKALTDQANGLGNLPITIDDSALHLLAMAANGDARSALNGLEIAALSTHMDEAGTIHITDQVIKESMQKKISYYDKNGEEHFNTISAFIKSMRGSDPHATLYYLAKLIESGEDPRFIGRRIIIAASEDVGNANPEALKLAVAAFQGVDIIGMPEGRILLAQAALFVATSVKSNAGYLGIEEALRDVRNNVAGEIPSYLKEASYSGARKLERGIGYQYPHDFPGGYVKQQYLPIGLENKVYYRPTDYGIEKSIGEYLSRLNKDMELPNKEESVDDTH